MTKSSSVINTIVDVILYIIVIIGSLNWLIIGGLNENYILKYSSNYYKYICILLGVAGIILVVKKWIECKNEDTKEHLTASEILELIEKKEKNDLF